MMNNYNLHYNNQNIQIPMTTIIQKKQKIVKYNDLQFKVLYDQKSIKNTVQEMANKITAHYKELLKNQQNPTLIVLCVLNGAFMFFTDLVRLLDLDLQEDFIRLSSYQGGMVSTNQVKFLTTVNYERYRGRHLLIVEDIIDTGKTLFELTKKLQTYEPKSIQIAALVRRPDKVQAIQCRWIGLDCSDFIIGYGLDLDEHFRALPQIYQKI